MREPGFYDRLEARPPRRPRPNIPTVPPDPEFMSRARALEGVRSARATSDGGRTVQNQLRRILSDLRGLRSVVVWSAITTAGMVLILAAVVLSGG